MTLPNPVFLASVLMRQKKEIYLKGDWIYKRYPSNLLLENEIYFFDLMSPTGYCPQAERWNENTLRVKNLGRSDPVRDFEIFRENMYGLLRALKSVGIRHGYLKPGVIVVKRDWPFITDFAESRFLDDPRPDKEKGSDAFWARKTIKELNPNIF